MQTTKLAAVFLAVLAFALGGARDARAASVDLSRGAIVARPNPADPAEAVAVQMLQEEIARRTGMPLSIREAPDPGPGIFLLSDPRGLEAWNIPAEALAARERLGPEGFVARFDRQTDRPPRLWILGADARGVLYGAGWFIRKASLSPSYMKIDDSAAGDFQPNYPIRGHQLGYRSRANSWDMWDEKQFDQHIRELTFFGVNAIENIPFEGESAPHMKYDRREMNRKMSEICAKYGIEYWVWTPADFDLTDAAKRAEMLEKHEELYRDCPRLDGVFFPGGDPGDNHPRLVMPFLEEVAARLAKTHPKAGLWISLQGFDREQVDYFYGYLNEKKPDWLAGVVAGPSSPPIVATRARLDAVGGEHRFRLRHYPDITHTVRCQYPVQQWDPAFAHTLGREPINPQPIHSRRIHDLFAPWTEGFLTYSDGVHDDVNKAVWSMAAWSPAPSTREMLADYARAFFGWAIAEDAADGLLALEGNWRGPIGANGGIDATLALWNRLEQQAPELRGNWRFQMCLLRANYDAYTRHRKLYEAALETEANKILAGAGSGEGEPKAAIDAALDVFERAEFQPIKPKLRKRVGELAHALYESIGLQTSVPAYNASGGERGAIMDYVDRPLNNRWWAEDELKKVAAMSDPAAQRMRLKEIGEWENPPGCVAYDDIGDPAKSAHVILSAWPEDDMRPDNRPNPDWMWWENGFSRQRLSWIDYLNWPLGLQYEGLDPKAAYVVRTTGYRDCLMLMNGQRVAPTLDGKGIGELKEFPVPPDLVKEGTLKLTFETPREPGINWREQSRLTEMWLIRKASQ